LGVDLPQESRIDAVEPLHDETGGDVPVTDYRASEFYVRADFHL
jgi:hypothetical protein